MSFGIEKFVLVGYIDMDTTSDIILKRNNVLIVKTIKIYYLVSYEAEYIAIQKFVKNSYGWKKILRWVETQKFILYCDTQCDIHLSKNLTFHSKSKYIDVKYY